MHYTQKDQAPDKGEKLTGIYGTVEGTTGRSKYFYMERTIDNYNVEICPLWKNTSVNTLVIKDIKGFFILPVYIHVLPQQAHKGDLVVTS